MRLKLWSKVLDSLRQRRRSREIATAVQGLEQRWLLATWSGELTGAVHWTNSEVQVVNGDIHIPQGSTLTIDAGTVIKFGAYHYDIQVDGTLLAQGTSGSPIFFTELRDDVGGDTNGDGSNSGPGNGNWGRIEFTANSTGSVMNYTTVRYGGYNSPGEIFVNGGQLTLTNSIINNSSSAGVRIVSSQPTLTSNTYQNNWGAAASMDLASNPAISGVTVSDNAINGLRLDGGTLTGNGFWNDPDIVYWMTDDILVPQGSSLTIAPGQVIKRPYYGDLYVEGSLSAIGTSQQHIVFTEFRDDVGGDTNHDGAASAPGYDGSGTIRFSSTSTANVMDYVEVRYGGYNYNGAVIVDSAPLTLTNSIITNSSHFGLRIQSSNPIVTNNTFANNWWGAASMDLSSNPAISGVTVTNNGVNGLAVDGGSATVNLDWNDPDIVYWMTDDITIPAGLTLTITAGVVIKRPYYGDLFVNGALIATGTAQDHVIFTEFRDDDAKGDTNNNGSAVGPSRDNAGSIQFLSTSTGNVMDYVEVRYGGYNVNGAVIVNSAPLTLTHSIITDSSHFGLRIQNSNPIVTNNTFANNTWGAASMDLSSNPAISGVTVTNNGVNGLAVDGGSASVNLDWNDPDIVYWMTDDITIPVGLTLTITPGVVIKRPYYGDLFVNGSLIATGTAQDHVIFTEFRDDDAKGDTNNNGSAVGPSRDNAGSIQFLSTSTGNVMDYVEVRYGGYNVNGAVIVDSAPLTLTNSIITDSSHFGLRIQNSNPIVTNNTFANNWWGAASMDLSSDPAISGVTVTNNGVNGLSVDSGTLTMDGHWDDPDIVYWLNDDITVPAGMTLSISPGQVIKRAYYTDLLINGSLIATGVAGAPIIFTERRDDTAGGDTNNDGANSGPGADNSGRIAFQSTSSGNLMDFVEIRYAGYVSDAVLVVDGADLSFTNGTIRNSTHNGILVRNDGSLTLANSVIASVSDTGLRVESESSVIATNNTVDGNYRGVLADGVGTYVSLLNNLITNNSNLGIVVSSRAVIAAAYNDVYNPAAFYGNFSGLTSFVGSSGNISVDPQYVDRPALDFHLQATSPVIDAGSSGGAPIDDRDFNFRVDIPEVTNTGAGASPFYDIGAYEFGGVPRAVKHSPNGKVSDVVSQLVLTFRSKMDRSSFALADDVISLSGPLGAFAPTGFHWLNDYQLAISFPAQAKAGNYQLVLGPGILNQDGIALDVDADGTPGEAVEDRYAATWTIVPPHVVQQTPQDFFPAPVDHLDLTFDRPMNQATFSLADDVVSFTGPNGAITPAGFSWLNDRTLRIQFDSQATLGQYELVLGPNIADIGGNLLDQNGNQIGGEAGLDQYSAAFTLADILHVSGSIQANTTWGGLILVDSDVAVASGVTLTINPGTIIKLADLTSIVVQSGGTLLANGTVSQPVIFTSLHDDSVGGDSDHNGNLIGPRAGDWISLLVDGGTMQLQSTEVRYGGGSTSGSWSQSGMLRTINGATLNISRSVLQDAYFDGVLTQGGTTTITNSVIRGADRGLVSWLTNAHVNVTNSTFVDNRVGLLGHGGTLSVVNSIVAYNLQFGIDNDISPNPTVTYTDLFNPGATNTRGFSNPVGVNGNISVDPKFKNLAQHDYRLGYISPVIDAANGAVAPATDFLGLNRYDDPRSANTGTVTGGGSFADMGAFEFVEGATSNIDLVVTTVVTPGSLQSGLTANLQWSVKNVGSAAALGDWFDAVYLSTDAVWSADDILLGNVLHTGDLAANQSYSANATLNIPVLTPGDYYVLVRTNANNVVFEGSHVNNNVTAAGSATALTVNLPTLVLNSPYVDVFSQAGGSHYFKFTLPEGQTATITLSGGAANGVRELFLGDGFVPTPSNFSIGSTSQGAGNQSLVIPAGGTNTYYLLAQNLSNAAATFTITVQTVPFSVRSVSPTQVGNAGFSSIKVEGASFTEDSTVTLTDTHGMTIVANSVQLTDGATLYAMFDMTGITPGTYTLKVTRGDTSTATATQTVQVVATSQSGGISTQVVLPQFLRPGRLFTASIVLTNNTKNDQVLPLLFLDSHNQAQLSFSPEGDGNSTLSIVPRITNGPFGLLPAGQSLTIPIYGRTNNDASSALNLTVDRVEYGDTPVNRAAIDAMFPLSYETMFGPRADEFRAYLDMLVGTTNAEFLRSIHFLANEMYREMPVDELLTVEDVWQTAIEIVDLIVENGIMDSYYQDHGITFGGGQASELPLQGAFGEDAPSEDPMGNDGTRTSTQPTNDRAGVVFNTEYTPTDASSGKVRYVLAGFIASENEYASSDFVRQVAEKLHCIYPNDTIKSVNWNSGTMGGFVSTILGSALAHGAIGAGIGSPTGVGAIGGGILGGLYGAAAGGINYYRIRANRTQLVGAAIAEDIRNNTTPGQAYIYGHSLGAQSAGYAGKELNGQLGGIVAFDPAGELFGGGPQDRLDPTDAENVKAIHTSGSFGQLGPFGTNPDNVGDENYYPPHLKWLVNAHAYSYEWYLQRLTQRCEEVMDGDVPPNTDPDLSLPPSTGSSNPNDPNTKGVRNGVTTNGQSQGSSGLVTGHDPNDLLGPGGFGPEGFLTTSATLDYMVQFENDPEHATAPAQEVFVTNQLDADMDWSTFAFGSFGFGAIVVTAPAGLQSYQTYVDTVNQDGSPLRVFIDANFDPVTGLVSVSFHSLDPATGQLPEDPFAGFLPVNDATHVGEGFFTYALNSKPDLPTGTQFTNQAVIVFDTNPSIDTPTALNTIDAGGPTSSVTALPAQSPAHLTVTWSGSDDLGGSGIASYDVYVSMDNGSYTLWQDDTTATSANYTGLPGHTYQFYSVATDNVGHVEADPETFDTSTEILANTAPGINNQSLTVAENSPATTVVGTVVATDPDVGDSLTYSITGGNTGNTFAINSQTGQITVANAALLNFETSPTWTLTVQVTDSMNATASATVTVNLTNVNEDPTLLDAIFSLAENSSVGTIIGTISGTDPDSGDTLSYSIIGGNSLGAFSLNPQTGVITVANGALLDFETQSTWTLSVQVSDNHQGTDLANVTIQLTDVNDVPQLSLNGGDATYSKKTNKTNAVKVAPGVLVLDADQSPGFAVGGGTLTLSMDAVGKVTKKGAKLYDTITFSGASALGTVTGPEFVDGKLVMSIQLNSNTTATAIQNFLRSISFVTKGAGLKQSQRILKAQLTDAAGAVSNQLQQTLHVSK